MSNEPNMSVIANEWSATPDNRYLVLHAPAGKAVSIRLLLTPQPGAAEHLPCLLVQAVRKDEWKPGVKPAVWMLWELLISSNRRGVLALDGRGPQRRTIEPRKSVVADWTRGDPLGYNIAFNPATGDVSLTSDKEVMQGQCFMKTQGEWVLVIGCPDWYVDLQAPTHWKISASWSIQGGEPAPLPPPVVTPKPEPGGPPFDPFNPMTLQQMHWNAVCALTTARFTNISPADAQELMLDAETIVKAHIDYIRKGGAR